MSKVGRKKMNIKRSRRRSVKRRRRRRRRKSRREIVRTTAQRLIPLNFLARGQGR